MNISEFFMHIHERAVHLVLGKRLVEKTRVVKQAKQKRFDDLKIRVDELCDQTHEICRESGIHVENGVR